MKVFRIMITAVLVVVAVHAIALSNQLKKAESRVEQLHASYVAYQHSIKQTQANLIKELTQPVVVDNALDLGEFKITYYDACMSCCGKTDGITKSGAVVCEGVTVAVDPNVIPLGTYIYIEGIGYRVAQDIGGAIKGKRIDVYVNTHEEALECGVDNKNVWILTWRGETHEK